MTATPGTPSQGAQSRLFVEPGSSPYTWDTDSERYEFLHENLQLHESFVYTNGISGTRSQRVEQTRRKTRMVRGVIVMNVSPKYLTTWLPRVFGAAGSGAAGAQTFALAETIPSFGVLIDRVGGVFEYKNCFVNRWMLSGEQSDPDSDEPNFLTMAMEIFGFDETSPDGLATDTGLDGDDVPTVPTIALPTTADYQYYLFDDMTVTLVAADREIKKFQLMLHNHLEPRWVASATPTKLSARHRTVMLETNNPFTVEDIALYNQLYSGYAGTLALTRLTCSSTFSFGALQKPRKSPVVPGKTELELPLTLFARMTGTTREISCLSDSAV